MLVLRDCIFAVLFLVCVSVPEMKKKRFSKFFSETNHIFLNSTFTRKRNKNILINHFGKGGSKLHKAAIVIIILSAIGTKAIGKVS